MTFCGAHLIQVIGHLDHYLALDSVLFQFSEEYGKSVWILLIWDRLWEDLPCVWSPSYFNLRKMFHLSLEVVSVEPCSMMWISLDDVTEAQSNTVKESQNLFCFYSSGYTAWLRSCSQAEKVKKSNFERLICDYMWEKFRHI